MRKYREYRATYTCTVAGPHSQINVRFPFTPFSGNRGMMEHPFIHLRYHSGDSSPKCVRKCIRIT